MVRNRKAKVDPKEIPCWYAIDLRDEFRIAGELSYSFMNLGRKGTSYYELYSRPSLSLWGKLGFADSEKVKAGMEVQIDLNAEDNEPKTNIIGFVEKVEDKLHFHIYLPLSIINHIHFSCISSNPEMFQIFGTDLYYRKGTVSGFDMSRSYEDEYE